MNGRRYKWISLCLNRMIVSWKDADARLLFETGRSRRLPSTIRRSAVRKLFLLQRAISLSDLRQPPGLQLEALKGDRKGQHSIRVNDQYRICFRWVGADAHDVEIVDYH